MMESLSLLHQEHYYESESETSYDSYHEILEKQASATTFFALPRVACPALTPRNRSWLRVRCSYNSLPFRRRLSQTSSTHRSLGRTCARIFACLIFVFLTLSLAHGILQPSYQTPPPRYQVLKERVESSANPGRANVRNEKIYIAANILDQDLIRGHWGQSLLSLIDLLGGDNVFVSIYENDSGAGTRDALHQLQKQFSCNSSVVTGEHVPLDIFPTVPLPNGENRVSRLTYLAEIRNRLLRPLDPSFRHNSTPGFRSVAGMRFDKILFLNDVYFSPLDAVQLLFSTNAESGEAQYRAACALDFVQLFKVYDTFVVRDTDGYPMSLQFYPWFTHLESGESRADALNQVDAIRVRSCWGGMAAFNATMFQPHIIEDKHHLVEIPEQTEIGLPGLPVGFRGSGEPFWETAECCLIFADLEHDHGLANIDNDSGVFINPYVRTAYSQLTWSWLPFFTRFERATEYFQTIAAKFKHPEGNPRRLHKSGEIVDEVVWTTSDVSTTEAKPDLLSRISPPPSQTGQFSMVHRKATPGGFCGQRRFFVMKKDIEAANKAGVRNWEKFPVPRQVHWPVLTTIEER